MHRASSLLCAPLLLAGCCVSPPRDDAYVARLQALALLQTLNADLLSHDSATQTLERWCADHRLADSARIIARRLPDAKPIPEQLRARLGIDANEPIAYRHVQLVCGEHVLSEADNWYVPGRLSAEMNRQLDSTDEPFGKVVKSLGFQRRTISAEVLWQPLADGWEMRRTEPAMQRRHIPRDVLRHQAVLYSATQTPFSAVVETYTSENIEFAIPHD